MKINCIAVDDEPLALDVIREFINATPYLQLTADFDNATEALKYLEKYPVDLLFIDIRMPRLTGLDVAKWIHEYKQGEPLIIFTTAHNSYAIDSYRVDAIDYLLKPFSYEDFLRASKKAINYLKLTRSKADWKPSHEYLFVRVGYQSVKVAFDDVVYLESLKDYVKIYLRGQDRSLVTLSTMKSLEEKLPPETFIRIQRSYIVSLDKIDAVSKSSVWIGNTEITIGAQYKSGFQEAVNERL